MVLIGRKRSLIALGGGVVRSADFTDPRVG